MAGRGGRSAGTRGRLSRRAALLGTVSAVTGGLAAPAMGRTRGKSTLRLVDLAGLEAEIAKHAGKVVIVDCWSTSCPPCVKEFPRLIELQKLHGDKVACISISFDYEGIDAAEDLVPPVEKFLDSVGAEGIVNLLCTEEADEVYRKLDLVSVPAVYVYAGDGSLARRFDEDDATKRLKRPFTYDDVNEAVAALLAR